MNRFARKLDYGITDEEYIEICNIFNSLPGIIANPGNIREKDNCRIWFKVDFSKGGEQGLFFLTRCVDGRYWNYGYRWNLTITVADAYKLPITFWIAEYEEKFLPICYCLSSLKPLSDKRRKRELRSMIKSFNLHLNHEPFLKGYNIDLSKFCLNNAVDFIVSEKRSKRREDPLFF